MEKYQTAAALARGLIAAYNEHKDAGRRAAELPEFNAKVEELVRYLLDNFGGSSLEMDAILGAPRDWLDPAVLAAMPQGDVPFAVMRVVLHQHKIAFNPNLVPSWAEYASLANTAFERSGNSLKM